MDYKLLQGIGLTEGESKVYLALLKLGETKTGNLVKKAGVSSSKVYKILDRLIVKGLVGFIIKGKVKYFKAMEFGRIFDYLDEEQEKLLDKRKLVEQILPELKTQQKSEKNTSAVIYQGFKAVTNFFRNLIDELDSGECYYVIGAGYGEEEEKSRRFFYKHHQRRALKRVKVKMLANYNEKGKLVKTTQKNSEIKYLPQYLLTNMEIVFYRNKVFIFLLTEEAVGFLIESAEAVKGFQSYFDTFWKIAKK